MYLVNEDDDVGILLQFLDELADAFLKLSAVFRSCHHACQIECYEPFAEEHGGTLPVCNHLGETLHDGTLTYARLSNQNRIVLLPSAENLHHALNLTLSSYDGVELVIQSLLGQVCREIIEHRSLRLLFRLCRRRCRTVLAAGSLLVVGFFFLVILVRKSDAVLDTQQRQRIFVVHIVHFQYMFCSVIYLVVQDGEQQVLFVNPCGALDTSFQHRQFQNIAGFFVQYQFVGVDRLSDFIFAHP